jgi:pyruvate,water dikinase
VETVGDRVTARFSKHESEEIEDKLDYIGRLLIFTRQMDMLMFSESAVNIMAECFMSGNYQYDPDILKN